MTITYRLFICLGVLIYINFKNIRKKIAQDLNLPPFIFHVLFFQRQGDEDKSQHTGYNNKRMDTSSGG